MKKHTSFSVSFLNLRDMFSDDPDVYKEFLKVCIVSISQNMDEITVAASEFDFTIISTIRHSMKPTFQFLELNTLIDEFSSLHNSDPDWPSKALTLVPALEEVNYHLQWELENFG
jgi:hypothetical protein